MDNESVENNEINISKLIVLLWKKKIFIASSSFLLALIVAIYSLTLPNIYRSEATIAQSSSTNLMSGQNSSFSSLGGLVGLSSSGGRVKVNEGIEILKSYDFFVELDEKYQISHIVYAAKGWEMSSDKVVYRSELFNGEEKSWITGKKPTGQRIFRSFNSQFKVIENKKNGFLKLTYDHYSPSFARDTLNKIILLINEKSKEKAVNEAQISINYLQNQLENTSLAPMQNALSNLIEKQLEIMMVSKSTDEYLFKVLNPPIVSEFKVSPTRSYMTIIAAILGAFLSSFYIVLRNILSKARE